LNHLKKSFILPLLGLLIAVIPELFIYPVNYIFETLQNKTTDHLSTGAFWALIFIAYVAVHDFILIIRFKLVVQVKGKPLYFIAGLFLIQVILLLYALGVFI